MSVDTLTLARELRAASFETPQAEAIAAAIGRAVLETAATKADLMELRASTKADFVELRAATGTDLMEMRAATKADFTQLRASTKADLMELRASTKADLAHAVAGIDVRFGILDNKVEQQGVRLSGEIKAGVAAVENTIMKWFIGAIIAIGSLILAAAKLF